MPHCIIEYATPLEGKISITKLIDDVFMATAGSGLFDTAAIKVRAIPFADFKTGAEQQNYVNTTVKLLPGRTAEQKKNLGIAVLEAKRASLEGQALLSVEVVDISESYFK
ncbi:5-carboxymethyl-2-hydroxymuconate Delta-isomerase [Kiloniella sp.]|uniref:5-carboxymethyl-2-hydroxymuconate Delta-isomerase n=1 Tax=Kiloniella sp. TaxID=1938587 RepID=UPI003B0262D9